MSGFPVPAGLPADRAELRLLAAIREALSGDVSTAPSPLTPLGYQQITDLSAAEALTVPEGARFALVQAEGESVRWRDDGTDPTDTVGVLIAADAAIWYTGDLAAFAAIEVAAGAILNVNYYG